MILAAFGIDNRARKDLFRHKMLADLAGTGDQVAIKMLKDRMGLDPLPNMDAACQAAVDAAKGA